jgi:hypothetical protein
MRKSSAAGAAPRRPPASPGELERAVLRQLCRARLTRLEWSRIERALRAYAWRDVEHGLVYQAIQRLAPRDSQLLREQLPAEATRMGFPEIDWQAYLSAEATSARLEARRSVQESKKKRSRAPTASEIERQIRRMQKAPA